MASQVMLFMGLCVPEIVLIFLVVVLLFGAKKLPELARGMGRGIRDFNDASREIKREIESEPADAASTRKPE